MAPTNRKSGRKAGRRSHSVSRKSDPSRRRRKAPNSGISRRDNGGGGNGGIGAATNADDTAKLKGILRVRMYRIGFGDFFLLTVPTASGQPEHVLIDCGVHACDIGSIGDCVQDLVKETGSRLALVIATHYHADHLSGFASQYEGFAQFEVGAVWITNRLDPSNKEAVNFQATLSSVADELKLRLGARLAAGEEDLATRQAFDKAQNAIGVELDAVGGSNKRALQLLTSGFKNKPPVYYYQGGDDPVLPDVLKGAITARILGPSPKDSGGTYAATDNRAEQYLTVAANEGLSAAEALRPFEKVDWTARALDYPASVFREYGSEKEIQAEMSGKPADLERVLQAVQPDVLAATADLLDGTLNNQSLVILFTCRGKKLLFVGDAQWGNWEYWLYGKAVTGQDPGISSTAKDILGSIDFYKVGHHGSTNATPIPAVGAMSEKCVAMCSTETAYGLQRKTKPVYGNPKSGTEVPRTKLMDALEARTKNKLVRSDWIAAGDAPASLEAQQELPKLPANFTPGDRYIDYVFPN